MNIDKIDSIPIPPIVKEYIVNSLNPNIPIHTRNNYRDLLFNIRYLCDEAIGQFDKELRKYTPPAKFTKTKKK